MSQDSMLPGDTPPRRTSPGDGAVWADAADTAQDRRALRQRLIIGGIIVVFMVLIGITISVLLDKFGTHQETVADAPAVPQPRPVLPVVLETKNFQVGDCFVNFNPDAPTSEAVACTAGHSAQLVAISRYPDDQVYPGREGLKKRTLETCQAATLSDKQNNYVLTYQLVYPSSTSWDKGDRRVDCFVMVSDGNTIKDDLLPK
ncbi:septum formation family protein [Arthrobacter sp. CJ23]|uniref:septum formation family protein n=1 Tax=Arthrobacter sp. CJ23 TaxID=2972479 RepID=UPI00215BA19D|nr:septum formation family protein [Arthrobacter sp. CJ23]UVJ39086.1 septum formation family protein [Arthrobacter sp. CJ23]